MTAFETWTLVFSGIADFIAIGALIAVIVGGVFAAKSFKAVLAQIRAAQWSTLLSLEQEMNSRSQRLQDLSNKMNDPATANTVSSKQFDTAKESYFNALDRLASLILNGQFPLDELKQDYHDVLKNAIRGFPQDFDRGTPFRKMTRLYEKWEDGN